MRNLSSCRLPRHVDWLTTLSVVSIQYTRARDRQTDRQTEGHISTASTVRAYNAAR